MGTTPVFHDPTGKRKRRLAALLSICALVAAVLSTGFVLSILAFPFLPRIPGFSEAKRGYSLLRVIPSVQQRRIQFLYGKAFRELSANIKADESTPRQVRPAGSDIVAAFYSSDHETAIHSLRANASRLTHLMPEWLSLSPSGSGLDLGSFGGLNAAENAEVIAIAKRNGIRICPILNNYDGHAWSPSRVAALLRSRQAQTAVATALKNWLIANRFDGVNIDFEDLRDEDYARLGAFIGLLRHELRSARLTVSLDVEAEKATASMKPAFDASDFVVLMAYDQHWASGSPGPIAAEEWTEKRIQQALDVIPNDRLVLGIGNYAYDWSNGSSQEATELTYQEALSTAKENDDDENADEITYDPDGMNPYFEYDDPSGKTHRVWMLDGVTAANQWTIGRQFALRGAALWSMGQEDPSLWSFLDVKRLRSPVDANAFKKVHFPYEPDDEGRGEILYVKQEPSDGRRSVEIDASTGLFTDAQYRSYPSSFVIRRWGFQPKKLALTFDDGPDPAYTPQIMEELKRLDVPATFFVIGTNAERHPELVRREYEQGHEIGSHTFYHPNLGAVSDDRIVFELNTTQRAIQSILGHSTVLFRPPYNADAEPTRNEEVHPVAVASRLGYLTVGELIDPQDWNLFRPGADGREHRRTGDEIASETIREVHQGGASVVLLHDGGGDRSETVRAIDVLVRRLRAEGYEFVPASTLAGLDRNRVMPPVTEKETVLLGVDKAMFWGVFTFESILALAFVAAIALGLARMGLIIPLALIHDRRKKASAPAGFRPTVSVLIAAYNEERVIVNTIRSVLRSEYPLAEIIVVDDGSTDGTGEAVTLAFGEGSAVRLVQQENGGKASALNRGIDIASGEILFCIDADTQLDPRAIGHLVGHFADARMGAVAGSVQVGNSDNLITTWQSIEYTTSQNLDRKAYALLNAITVVPGAIGAWRTSAVRGVGGYRSDTLAEDMDLTWRLRRAGWRMETESRAVAYTEAPESLRAFAKQRFRWAFGTLQCLWKHRSAVGRHGWFGCLALPALWLFQVLFQILAPLVDIQLIYSVFGCLSAWTVRGVYSKDWQPLPDSVQSMMHVGFLYAVFFAVELAAALIAYRMDRLRADRVWWLFFQRFLYRQVMYAVICRSVSAALRGMRPGWGKLDRTASVRTPLPSAAET